MDLCRPDPGISVTGAQLFSGSCKENIRFYSANSGLNDLLNVSEAVP